MEKIDKGHPKSQSTDFVAQNIETLKTLFPTIVKEGKIDIKELQALLGDDVETEEEYYRFTWAGKSMARREANKPSTATLRPDKESSKDWDTTQNIFIEGDNLEVLKLLQKSYANKIKMIYIDPPYNTGKDFVYKDNYNDNLGNYLAITGQVDEEGKRINTNSESDGRYHSNWLNMMYPRLKLARNLMTDDGVIFISIDDNEFVNLKKICDEVFGSDNFLASFVWEQGRKSAATTIAVNHEYCLVFAKHKNLLIQINNHNPIYWRDKKEGLEIIYAKELELRSKFQKDFSSMNAAMKEYYKLLGEGNAVYNHKHYNQFDENGIYFPDNTAAPDKPETRSHKPLIHPITGKNCKVPSMGWRYNDETLARLVSENRIHFGQDENTVPCIKRYLKETEFEVTPTVFYKDGRGASKRLEELLGGKYFDFPKDENIIKKFISYILPKSNNEGVILDFFAGSGTTAHSAMKINSEDAGNRKFICVQLPEPTDEKSEAFKAGYKSISEITKERIRRAGEKIKSEMKEDLFSEQGKTLDIGFRAFKLDSSNIRAWDGNPDALEDNLFNAGSNIKENRTEEDVLYEILLKYGLDLTMPIEQKAIAGKQVFNIGMGALFICLGDNITKAVAEGIGKWKEELQPATSKVIFKDTGFTDVEKTNSMQILKRYGILEVNTI
ncbi:site-specific DNA-methyltransferase [Flavobacterium filum]|uniref:site-specific DNA-methyltransferase n=1 Tax=Flavobacterium filum TaxID=370974 RepID=UPI0023F3F91B|nr:site-specific DNA-methyltransferase [Flavobacterium filum]